MSRHGEVDDTETAWVDGAELEAEPHVGGHREVVMADSHDVDRGLISVVVCAVEEVRSLSNDSAIRTVELQGNRIKILYDMAGLLW